MLLLIRVFDLHQNIPLDELKTYDVVYLCGGRTSYLLSRINDTGFRGMFLSYIREGGLVLEVSAGSLIFANSLPENLRLSNTAAMLIRSIPEDVVIIDD